MFYTKSRTIQAVELLLICVSLAVGAAAQDITYTVATPEARDFLMQGLERFDGLQFAEARGYFQKAIAADPACAMAYFFLANSAATNEAFLTAINKAYDLAPKVSEPERVMIQAAKAGVDGNTAEVHKLNLRLVELVPQSPRARVALGYDQRGRQDFTAAESEFREAIKLDPKYAPAYNALAYTLADLGRYPEAIEALKQYAALRPKDPNPHDSMAELYLWTGDHQNSIAEYNASLALDPKFSGSILGLGHNYTLMGQFDKARETYNSWLKEAANYGDSSLIYYWVATAYVAEGKPAEAIKVWQDEDAFGKAHNDIYIQLEARGNMSRLYRENGEYDRAAAEFQAVRNLLKDSTLTQIAFDVNTRDIVGSEAIMYAYQGKTADAQAKLTELRKSVESANNPGVTKYLHYVQGEIALAGQDYAAALADFDQADPQSPHIKYHMAICQEKLGKADQAKEAYTWISTWNRNGLELAMFRPMAMKKI